MVARSCRVAFLSRRREVRFRCGNEYGWRGIERDTGADSDSILEGRAREPVDSEATMRQRQSPVIQGHPSWSESEHGSAALYLGAPLASPVMQ
jgi:hypothetical protein